MSKRLEANDNLVKWKKASRVISLESHWKGMWDFRTRNANFLAYSPPSILQAFWLRNWLSIIECCWVLRKQRENSKLNFTVAPHQCFESHFLKPFRKPFQSFFKAFSLLYKENLSEENFGLPQKQKSSTVCTTSSDEFKVKLKFRLSLSFLVLEATQCDPSLSKSAAGGGVFTLH